MVFANIYSRLNEIERRVNELSLNKPATVTATTVTAPATAPATVDAVTADVDLSPLNEKLVTLDERTTVLENQFKNVNSKIEGLQGLPTESDVSNILEKINQITNILAQFSMQMNGILERVAKVEQTQTDMAQVQAQLQQQVEAQVQAQAQAQAEPQQQPQVQEDE